MNNFTNAKKVFDFYMEKAGQDTKVSAIYAIQYANLRIFKQRTEAILNSLESYDIGITE